MRVKKLVGDDGGFGATVTKCSVSFRGILGSGPRFCGLGARPCTCGLGAGPQHLPFMCPQPPETQNKKLGSSSFWLFTSCPLVLIDDFSHRRMDGPSSLPAPWILLIPLASRYKGVSALVPLPMTDGRLWINIPISSPLGGGDHLEGGTGMLLTKSRWNPSLAHGIPLSDMPYLGFSSFPVPLCLILTLLLGPPPK